MVPRDGAFNSAPRARPRPRGNRLSLIGACSLAASRSCADLDSNYWPPGFRGFREMRRPPAGSRRCSAGRVAAEPAAPHLAKTCNHFRRQPIRLCSNGLRPGFHRIGAMRFAFWKFDAETRWCRNRNPGSTYIVTSSSELQSDQAAFLKSEFTIPLQGVLLLF